MEGWMTPLGKVWFGQKGGPYTCAVWVLCGPFPATGSSIDWLSSKQGFQISPEVSGMGWDAPVCEP